MTVGLASRAQLGGVGPRNFGKLIRWYDASYPLGFGGGVPADGSAIQTLKDLTANPVDLLQNTAANRPLWRAAGSNICPGVDKWILSGGTTVDLTTGIITIPFGGTADVYIKVDGAPYGVFSAEFNAGAQSNNANFQPNGGRRMSAFYYAADKTTLVYNAAASPGPYLSNGNAVSIPVGSYSNRLAGSTLSGNWQNTLGPNVVWLRLQIQNESSFGSSSPLLMRMPQYDLSRPVTEYVPPSPLPLFCSTEQNPRWFIQSTNGGLPLDAYTAYLVGAFGNVSGGSRWVAGTRVGSSGSTIDRTMILQSGGLLYMYSPTQGGTALYRAVSIPSPRVGRPFISSHIWYNDAATLGLDMNGTPHQRLTPTGWADGRQTYANFSGPFCLLGYSTTSAIMGGVSAFFLYQGIHDTFTRKRIERWLGARAGMTIPMAA